MSNFSIQVARNELGEAQCSLELQVGSDKVQYLDPLHPEGLERIKVCINFIERAMHKCYGRILKGSISSQTCNRYRECTNLLASAPKNNFKEKTSFQLLPCICIPFAKVWGKFQVQDGSISEKLGRGIPWIFKTHSFKKCYRNSPSLNRILWTKRKKLRGIYIGIPEGQLKWNNFDKLTLSMNDHSG